MTQYDGTTPLQPALAALCGCSVKNQAKIAKLTKQAKDALGIEGKRTLPPSDNLAVYQWHYERLNVEALINRPYPSQAAKRAALFNEIERITESRHTRGSTATTHIESVETIADDVPVKTITIPLSPTDLTPVEIDARRLDIVDTDTPHRTPIPCNIDAQPVDDDELQAKLMEVYHAHATPAPRRKRAIDLRPYYDDYESVQVRFYANNKRQFVVIDGWLLNQLMTRAKLDKRLIPDWIEARLIADDAPITKQVERLIVCELLTM